MTKYLNIIDKFVKEMDYHINPHFLGIYFYGSSLTSLLMKIQILIYM